MNPDSSPSPGGKRTSKKKSPPAKEPRSAPDEADLWDLDHSAADPGKNEPEEAAPEPAAEPSADTAEPEIPEEADEPAPAQVPVEPRGPRRDSMPFKRFPAKSRTSGSPTGEPETSPAPKEAEPSKRSGKSPSSDRKPVIDAFDELEATLASHPDASEPSAPPEAEKEEVPAPADESTPSPVPGETPAPPVPSPAPEPSKGLSKVEKISLLAFLALFAAIGVFFFLNSISKMPEEVKPLTPRDFPIKGAGFEASGFNSYWRDPVDSDTVRRGTIIIPVVEIGVKGGPAAVRVFFRNSDGVTVGDAVTRPVNGETTLVLPATAGFEEPGQHAAYRAGDMKTWSVEVFEGPSADAPGRDFKKLFEIPISSNLR